VTKFDVALVSEPCFESVGAAACSSLGARDGCCGCCPEILYADDTGVADGAGQFINAANGDFWDDEFSSPEPDVPVKVVGKLGPPSARDWRITGGFGPSLPFVVLPLSVAWSRCFLDRPDPVSSTESPALSCFAEG